MNFEEITYIVDSHSLGLAMLNIGDAVAKNLYQLVRPCSVLLFLTINSPLLGGLSARRAHRCICLPKYASRRRVEPNAWNGASVSKFFSLKSNRPLFRKLHCGKWCASVVVTTMTGCLLTECQAELRNT